MSPAPFGPARSYCEMEARKKWLEDKPEDQLRLWLKEAGETIEHERANFTALCKSRSLFEKLFVDGPLMKNTIMGKVIDECHNAISYIRDELARRGLNPEEPKSKKSE